jgi:hypothetical protein
LGEVAGSPVILRGRNLRKSAESIKEEVTMTSITLVVDGNSVTKSNGDPQPKGSVQYVPGVSDDGTCPFQSKVFIKRRWLDEHFGEGNAPKLIVSVEQQEY